MTMKQFRNVVLVGTRATLMGSTLALFALMGAILAGSALGQPAKPPPKPAPSPLKPVSASPSATTVPSPSFNPYAGFKPPAAAARPLVRHPVFVPPPAVIELDEIAAPA